MPMLGAKHGFVHSLCKVYIDAHCTAYPHTEPQLCNPRIVGQDRIIKPQAHLTSLVTGALSVAGTSLH